MNPYNKKYKIIETYGVLLLDILCIAVSYLVAFQMRFGAARDASDGNWLQVYIVCVAVCLLYNTVTDSYHHFFKRGFYEEALNVIRYHVFLFVVVSAGMYVFRMELEFSRLFLGYFVVLDAVFTYVARLAFKKYMRVVYRRSSGSDKLLLVTTQDLLGKLLDSIEEDQGWSYELNGIALLDAERIGERIRNIPVVSGRKNLVDAARQGAFDIALFCCPEEPIQNLEMLIQSLLAMGMVCHNCAERLNIEAPNVSAGSFAAIPVITYSMTGIDYRRRAVKRVIDIVGSLVGLLFTAVFTPFVAFAIKLDSPGPVFFSQIRIGKNGRRFRMYKFRSMYVDAETRKQELMQQNEVDGLMFKLERDPRITRVGAFLRRTSIDELPQFWNVLRGDMSLVGTRPPTEDEFEQYNIYYKRRLSMTPGLTGMWQVSGRSDIRDFDEVVRLDLSYIDDWSLSTDLKILLQTIGVVLSGRGSK